ncbi:hypothetical protein [Promicromonospora sp. NPDC050262]|uniref:hypothetical protein n=1 Tax=Promicromonospora sp. NPDC050262 TaxID=3155036 RepID=UPI0033F7CEED
MGRPRRIRRAHHRARADGAALLRLADALGIVPAVTRYPFDETGAALADLRSGRASGSLVVVLG